VQRLGSALLSAAVSAALLCICWPGGASAVTERARLHADFSPDRLGAATTISFGFHLETTGGLAPPPLSSVDLRLPAGINYTTTTLGLAICQPAVLQARGLAGCSPNSRLGYGSAFVEVPFGAGDGQELPEVQAVMGPPRDGNLVVLFYANGREPVSAQIVFAGEVLPASGIFGSHLAALVPAIASVPGGPDVSVVSVQSTIGPRNLTYYHRRHGRLVPFRPEGVSVPERCPRGGFPFAADFGFQDASHTTATTRVPCPPHRRHR
jgi:hypothetical protein